MTLDALFATVTPKIGRILDKALADEEINVSEAESLFHAKGCTFKHYFSPEYIISYLLINHKNMGSFFRQSVKIS